MSGKHNLQSVSKKINNVWESPHRIIHQDFSDLLMGFNYMNNMEAIHFMLDTLDFFVQHTIDKRHK